MGLILLLLGRCRGAQKMTLAFNVEDLYIPGTGVIGGGRGLYRYQYFLQRDLIQK